jgi:hypothetical protein
MSLGEGTDAYSQLASATPCDVYGFEPVAVEFEAQGLGEAGASLPAVFRRRRVGADILRAVAACLELCFTPTTSPA